MNNLTKFVASFSLFIMVIFSLTVFTQGSPLIKVVVNGKEIQSDVPPVLVNDRLLLPMRAIAENLGANVVWDQNKQTAFVNIKENGLKVMKLNSDLTTWPYWEKDGKLYLEYRNAMELLRTVYNPIFNPISYSQANNILTIGNKTVNIQTEYMDGYRVLNLTELRRLYYINYEWDSEQANLTILDWE